MDFPEVRGRLEMFLGSPLANPPKADGLVQCVACCASESLRTRLDESTGRDTLYRQ